ncbi:hypothetical protein BJY01DRAFT_218113 [Aspergillus pseudoustus]|uniref:Lysosomal dipeptide transporter MFSD1 n=1 Tax=Aspergillus pseudoustus TaxID=1810923 RepID=A0ABR4JME4_9EURO
MVVGRVFFGLGGEVVGVLGCEIITRWFQHKRLSLALAINLGLGRLGSVSNSILVPWLIELYGVIAVTWIATLLAIGVSTIGLISFLATSGPATEPDQIQLIPENPDKGLDNNKPLSQTALLHHFPRIFWDLARVSLIDYACLNTFTNSAQRLLAIRFYNGDQPAAGAAVSILFVLSGFLISPLGFLLDALPASGYPRALITSNALLILAHGIFLTDSISTPIVPLCLIGTADALLSVAFWGSVTRCLLHATHAETRASRGRETCLKDELVPLLREEMMDITPPPSTEGGEDEEVGLREVPSMQGEAMRTLGIGIMTSLMNISTAVVPAFLAVVENAAGFLGLEFVFLVLGVMGCVVCVRLAWTWELDCDGGGREEREI